MVRRCCLRKFHSIRRDHIASRVFPVIEAFRVDEDGYPQFMPTTNDRLADRITQHSLAVVRQDDGRASRHLRLESRQNQLLQLNAEVTALLDGQADHLLASTEYRRLA